MHSLCLIGNLTEECMQKERLKTKIADLQEK